MITIDFNTQHSNENDITLTCEQAYECYQQMQKSFAEDDIVCELDAMANDKECTFTAANDLLEDTASLQRMVETYISAVSDDEAIANQRHSHLCDIIRAELKQRDAHA